MLEYRAVSQSFPRLAASKQWQKEWNIVMPYSTDIYFLHRRRLDVCQCPVVQTPMDNMSKYLYRLSIGPSSLQIKLRSVVRSSVHPFPEYWVAIGPLAVFYARVAHVFSAGIKCWYCTLEIGKIAIWSIISDMA